jgi:class 3 adenylate cyclase
MAKQPAKGNVSTPHIIKINTELTPAQGEILLTILKARFEQNMNRHQGLAWSTLQAKLHAHPDKLLSLHAMESTGGAPDVVGFEKATGDYIFVDCAAESPEGRRNVCYDGEGQAEREKKGVYPAGNALDLAAAMGIALLDEDHYRALQKLGTFDTKTSSWIATPPEIRERGGALFADRRYDHVFVYHNSAPSFYSSRGFRGLLRV